MASAPQDARGDRRAVPACAVQHDRPVEGNLRDPLRQLANGMRSEPAMAPAAVVAAKVDATGAVAVVRLRRRYSTVTLLACSA
ncbi:hypothetical protein SAMN05421837_11836 [Amycolatopsis pretoriensis]|uniref:Uncharacterized protein n=1 Tax=Amycolatopsis pretoriensis TaxID=218821 RepID=A0A1H5RI93_9PSEU|nr:hypothetical protein SAMN05421837_11836 [Amycolatopsis pretoriensis]